MIYFLEVTLPALVMAMGIELEVLRWSQIDAEAAGTRMVEVEMGANLCSERKNDITCQRISYAI